MKKIFLLLYFCFATAAAQESCITHKLPFESDFETKDGRMLLFDFPSQIDLMNQTDQILISVICKTQAFEEFGVQKINDMILFANNKVRTFYPLEYGCSLSEIKMSYNPEVKAWSMTSLCTLKDGQGMQKENLLALDFDAQGQFLLMKKIF